MVRLEVSFRHGAARHFDLADNSTLGDLSDLLSREYKVLDTTIKLMEHGKKLRSWRLSEAPGTSLERAGELAWL
jgi:hypothetical protein